MNRASQILGLCAISKYSSKHDKHFNHERVCYRVETAYEKNPSAVFFSLHMSCLNLKTITNYLVVFQMTLVRVAYLI